MDRATRLAVVRLQVRTSIKDFPIRPISKSPGPLWKLVLGEMLSLFSLSNHKVPTDFSSIFSVDKSHVFHTLSLRSILYIMLLIPFLCKFYIPMHTWYAYIYVVYVVIFFCP